MMEDLDIRPIQRLEILALVEERKYSLEKWGNELTCGFDEKNTVNDWVTYICMYATKAAAIDYVGDSCEIYAHLIKAANLALLAAERVRLGTRAPRHYEETVEPMEEYEWDAEYGELGEDKPLQLGGVMRGGGDGIVT